MGYKYYRVVINSPQNPAGLYCSVAELELLGDPQGSDLTTPTSGVMTASSYANSSNVPHMAFDGDPYYKWTAVFSGSPQWLQYQHPTELAVSAIAITAATWTDSEIYQARDFDLLGSNDGVTWDMLLSVTNTPAWTTGQRRVFVLDGVYASVSGTVLLDGSAYPATVRAYNAATGALREETVADPSDGSYTLSQLFTGQDYHIVAIPASGVRPLIHGPVQGI
jgi:hypothetical protein